VNCGLSEMSNSRTKNDKATDLVAAANAVYQPSSYFEREGRTLNERLQEVRVDDATEQKIARDAGSKLILDKVLGSFKLGALVSAILNWDEAIQKDIKSFKRDALLAKYFDQSDAHEAAIDALRKFITNPQGNTLFNKIMRILDDNPPDMELLTHLATVLRHMAQDTFSEMFEEHKYALSLIEQLSPQALTIIADHTSWPDVSLGSGTSRGGKVTSDYVGEFADTYVRAKAIKDAAVAGRVAHSISDLHGRRLIHANMVRGSVAKCTLTEIGQLLARYLT
jgi:hypothetical protein